MILVIWFNYITNILSLTLFLSIWFCGWLDIGEGVPLYCFQCVLHLKGQLNFINLLNCYWIDVSLIMLFVTLIVNVAFLKECFESLLSILHWSWTTLVLGVEELRGLKGFQYTATLLDLERLRFVGTCCLRLLRVYTCEIYPIAGTTFLQFFFLLLFFLRFLSSKLKNIVLSFSSNVLCV